MLDGAWLQMFKVFSIIVAFSKLPADRAFPLFESINPQSLIVRMASSTTTTGADMLAMQKWAVVGDALNENKPAFRIAKKLQDAGKDVHIVNPREKTERCARALYEIDSSIDVVDLVISPKIGPRIIDDCASLGIKNVFIQPGAESDEILEKCSQAGISVHQGCVLVEL